MKILLVDDHSVVRDGLRAVLRRLLPEAQFAEAGNAAQALEQAAAFNPAMILVDINLPGLSGLELISRFRATLPQARLLVVAAESDPWTVRRAMQAGASGYLVKTNASEHLPAALESLGRGERFLGPESKAALGRAEADGLAASDPPGVAVLSWREQQVLKALAAGQTTKAIALQLEVSPKTIETHRSHIMRKLRLDNVAALTRYAIHHGLSPV